MIFYRCRVKVFAKFNVHPFDVDECKNENMSYDAFVSCAGAEDDLAREIVDRLRGRNAEEEDRDGYQVCYHEDDFLPGRPILSNIEQAIEHSKRVICLLTTNFLRSGYCMLEFRAAYSWNVRHKRHRLIVVKCPGVDEALAAAERDAVPGVEDVRMFLSTYTYIEHGSDDWWQKLLYAMPINRLPTVDFDLRQRFFDGANNDDREALVQDM